MYVCIYVYSPDFKVYVCTVSTDCMSLSIYVHVCMYVCTY